VRQQTGTGLEEIGEAVQQPELDLVIPFTTPELTRAAVEAANRMAHGLNAKLRLIKVQVVPYPMDLQQSPVYLDFLKDQLAHIESELPASGEIRLAREFEPGLEGTLTRESLIILATLKRPWRTRTESMAAALRRAGHNVVLVVQERQRGSNA
jgi:hypothetical protein